MLEQIYPGLRIQHIKSGAKYIVTGPDMGFVACVRDTPYHTGEVYRYTVPYLRQHFEEVPKES